MLDVLLAADEDGIDAYLNAEDFALTNGLETAIFLALFGGNDYWANNLLLADDQYTGKTLDVCKSVALNTSGRLKIEQAIKDDLRILAREEGLELSVAVKIQVDRADITIYLGNMAYEYTYYSSGGAVFVNKREK